MPQQINKCTSRLIQSGYLQGNTLADRQSAVTCSLQVMPIRQQSAVDQQVRMFLESKEGKVIYLGVCFLILFTGFNSLQNMVGQIYDQAGFSSLGVISVFFIYGFFSLASLIVLRYSRLLGYRKCFVLSALGYVVFMLSGMLVTYCETNKESWACGEGVVYSVVLVGSAVCGVSAIHLWVSQGGYVGELADESTKGKLYAVFWMLMMSSQIIGNVLITFLLQRFTHFEYFLLTFALGMVATIMLGFIGDTGRESKEEAPTLAESIDNIKQFLARPAASLTVYAYAFVGVTIGIYAGFLFKLVELCLTEEQKKNDLNYYTGMVFIALGCAQALTGLVLRFVSDRFASYSIVQAGAMVVEFAGVATLLNLYLKEYALCFVCSALWGSSETILQTGMSMVVTGENPDSVKGFSLFRMFFSLGVALTLILSVLLKNVDNYVLILVVLVLQALTTVVLPHLQSVNKQKESLLETD